MNKTYPSLTLIAADQCLKKLQLVGRFCNSTHSKINLLITAIVRNLYQNNY